MAPFGDWSMNEKEKSTAIFGVSGHARGRKVLPAMERACLLVVDLQRIFVDPTSPAYASEWSDRAPNVARLVSAFTAMSLPVLRTRHVHGPDDKAGTMAYFFDRLLVRDDPLSEMDPSIVAGTEVIEKAVFSAMTSTKVVEAVQSAGGRVVIVGVHTHRCVLATAVDCARFNFMPVVVADACSAPSEDLHSSALQVLASGHAFVATTDEVINAIRRPQKGQEWAGDV